MAIAVGWYSLLRSKFKFTEQTCSLSCGWIFILFSVKPYGDATNKCSAFTLVCLPCKASLNPAFNTQLMNEIEFVRGKWTELNACAIRSIYSNLFRWNGKWILWNSVEDKYKQKCEMNLMRSADNRHSSVCFRSPSLEVMLTERSSSHHHKNKIQIEFIEDSILLLLGREAWTKTLLLRVHLLRAIKNGIFDDAESQNYFE